MAVAEPCPKQQAQAGSTSGASVCGGCLAARPQHGTDLPETQGQKLELAASEGEAET